MRTVGRNRKDMTKLIASFRNFANAPKNYMFCPHSSIQHELAGFYSREGVCTARYELNLYI
jgi:hypothetical protein